MGAGLKLTVTLMPVVLAKFSKVSSALKRRFGHGRSVRDGAESVSTSGMFFVLWVGLGKDVCQLR